MEEWISELEDRVVEIADSEQKKIMKRNDNLRELWGNIKCTDIYIKVVPEEEKRENRAENIIEKIIANGIPNLRRKQTSKSKKFRESHLELTQRGIQDTL